MDRLHGGAVRVIARRVANKDGRREVQIRSPSTDWKQAPRFIVPDDGPSGRLELEEGGADQLFRTLARSGLDERLLQADSVRLDAYCPIWGDYPDIPTTTVSPAETDALLELGRSITLKPSTGDKVPDSDVPAAYTYIGQFIAHDVSDMRINLTGTINLQTTSLDLSSLFGPPEVTTHGFTGPTFRSGAQRDLPRAPTGCPAISDQRNDANLGVAQVHNMVARFFLQELKRLNEDAAAAKRSTINHFQQAVLDDYLPRLVGQVTVDKVLSGKRLLQPAKEFLLPMEFALAFFRFGHAQVRDNYFGGFGDHFSSSETLINFTHDGGAFILSNNRLPDGWAMVWPAMIGTKESIFARQISARIAFKHGSVASNTSHDPQAPDGDRVNLAAETLIRGKRLNMPTAQVLTKWIEDNHPGLAPLGAPDISDPNTFQDAVRHTSPDLQSLLSAGLVEETPLWLYTLLESQATECGNRLGPLAGRVVAETLIAAIEADPDGIKSLTSKFKPAVLNKGKFGFNTMSELAFST